uniref:Git3 domain-containing protein n=1 Tax=Macrostomum lignano TaxID=282301 RepID=A0A1I8H9S3_9PLAT
VYVVTGFLLPVLPASLPFAGSAYGPAGAWCWITDTAWRMAVWFVPVLLLLLAILTVYIIILTRIRRRTTTWSGMYGEESAAAVATAAVQLQEQLYPLLAYPCIFLALNLLPFVNRINNAASAEPSFVLYLLSAQRLRTGGRQTESVVQEYNADGDGGQGGGMMDIATSTLTFSRFQNEAVDDQSQLQQPPLQHRLAEGEEQRASSVGLRPATDRY